jgi:hypothetical protein
LTADELATASGLPQAQIAVIEEFGLVTSTLVGGVPYYDEAALAVAGLVARFANYGIEPRHLRLFRNAVEREMGLIEQVVTPLLRRRNPEARRGAQESSSELSSLGQELRDLLLRRELQRLFGV